MGPRSASQEGGPQGQACPGNAPLRLANASRVALTWQAPAVHLPLSRPRVLVSVQSPALWAQAPLGWHASHCTSQRSSAGAAGLLHPIACKGAGQGGGRGSEQKGLKC